MSEGAAEGGGAPLSDGQFGGVTETGDIPPTAQNPGTGLFGYGFYPWYQAQFGARRPKKRKRER